MLIFCTSSCADRVKTKCAYFFFFFSKPVMSYPHSSLLEAKSAQTLIQKKPFACNFHIQSEGIEGLIPLAGKMSGNGLNVACNEIMT